MTAYLYITLLTDIAKDKLVLELVKKGYTVGPGWSDGRLSVPGTVSSLLALKMEVPQTDAVDTAEALRKSVSSICHEACISYHSFCVHCGNCTRWQASNITVPVPEKPAKTIYDTISSDTDK